MGEEYAEDKFNLLTICLGKQTISDLRGWTVMKKERRGERGSKKGRWWGRGGYQNQHIESKQEKVMLNWETLNSQGNEQVLQAKLTIWTFIVFPHLFCKSLEIIKGIQCSLLSDVQLFPF